MTASFDITFDPGQTPAWILDFHDDPDAAVDALLRGTYYFGSLNATDPVHLLVDWVLALDGEADFHDRLDAALRRWIERQWGRPPDTDSTEAKLFALAWQRLADVVAHVRSLDVSVRALVERFPERRVYLGPLSVSPSCDPLGHYLACVAVHQKDRALAAEWWELCSLPFNAPVYHGRYGLRGVRGMPASSSAKGGFRVDVAYGIRRLAVGYARATGDGRIAEDVASREFLASARLTIAALPSPSLRWREVFFQREEDLPPAAHRWLAALAPAPPRKAKTQRIVTGAPSFDPAWKSRADAIVGALASEGAAARSSADGLLEEERTYAQASGDSDPLVRSLCRFSVALWSTAPPTAVEFADEARRWEPWNAYCWTTLMQAHVYGGDLRTAADLGWEALERFPDNAVAFAEQGAILERLGRLPEAEEVLRVGVERFATHAVLWTVLARVVHALGKPADADALYRHVVGFAPSFIAALGGYSELLAEQGKLADAEEIAERAVALPDAEAINWSRLGRLQVARGRYRQAERTYAAAVRRFPKDPELAQRLRRVKARLENEEEPAPQPYVRDEEAQPLPDEPAVEERKPTLGELRYLRRAIRRARDLGSSRETLEALAASLRERAPEPADARFETERALLMLDLGEVDGAFEALTRVRAAYPGAVEAGVALARAKREAAARADRIYSDTVFHDLVAPLHEARRVNPSLRPLELVDETRALLALNDGQPLAKAATRAVRRLRRVAEQDVVGTNGGTFNTWWIGQVTPLLTSVGDGDAELSPEDVAAMKADVAEHTRFLDQMGEDFAFRVVAP